MKLEPNLAQKLEDGTISERELTIIALITLIENHNQITKLASTLQELAISVPSEHITSENKVAVIRELEDAAQLLDISGTIVRNLRGIDFITSLENSDSTQEKIYNILEALMEAKVAESSQKTFLDMLEGMLKAASKEGRLH